MSKINKPESKKLVKDNDLNNKKHDDILTWIYRNAGALINNQKRYLWTPDYIPTVIGEKYHSLCNEIELLERMDTDHFDDEDFAPLNTGYFENDDSAPTVNLRTETELAETRAKTSFLRKCSESREEFLKHIENEPPEYTGVSIDKIELQVPIFERLVRDQRIGKTRKITAFVDMQATIGLPILTLAQTEKNSFAFELSHWGGRVIWYFDVRSSIDNIGSLLREIAVMKNLIANGTAGQYQYDEPTFSGVYAVVAPLSKEQQDVLEAHDITCIAYDPQLKINDAFMNQN